MWRCCTLLGLVGCAAAGRPDQPVDAGARDAPAVDALDIDASTTRTLTQTADNTPAGGLTIGCYSQTGGYTREESWYRVFSLAGTGITSPFVVSQVTFGIESSEPSAQLITIKLGTYAGTPGTTIDPAMITQLAATTSNIPVVSMPHLRMVPITATVPVNGKLVVEINVPDGMSTGRSLFVASSASAETAPGYLRSSACTETVTPRSMKDIDPTAGSLIIEVTGMPQ